MKALFDQVINTKLDELQKYASFILNVGNKRIDIQTLISNAYLQSIRFEVENEQKAKATLFHFIKCEVLYTGTQSKKELINSIDVTLDIEQIESEVQQFNPHDIIDKEVKKWDFIDQILWNKFFDLKKQNKKIKDLAQLYDVDVRYCRKKIKQFKKRLHESIKD